MASGAEVDLTYTSNWTGNYTGSGGGHVVLEPVAFAYLNFNGATLNFPAGMLEWTTGTLEGNFTNLDSMTVTGAGTSYLYGSLTNKGSMVLDAASFAISGSSSSTIDNEGAMELGQGIYVSDRVTTANTGTITLDANSTLGIESTDSSGVIATGTYNVGAGAVLTFLNLGSITENDATITLDVPVHRYRSSPRSRPMQERFRSPTGPP